MNQPEDLLELLRASSWLQARLQKARDLRLPDWFLGAGAIRDLAWDTWFGHGFEPRSISDLDLVYFDPVDLSHDAELVVELRLGAGWDVKNQARVHLWYADRFGGEAVAPLTSTTDGISTWPETATCVGVRLEDDDSLTIAAPHGLDDLLAGVWRVNPSRVTPDEAALRLARKAPATRWPGVRVI